MRPMDGFPDSFGSHRVAVFPHRGPVLYAPVVAGVAPALATAGDLVQAVECGLKFFEFVTAGLTDSGVYRVECLPTAVSGIVGSNSPSQGQPKATYRLRWVVVATGAQAAAVDLSAEIVRLFAIGPK